MSTNASCFVNIVIISNIAVVVIVNIVIVIISSIVVVIIVIIVIIITGRAESRTDAPRRWV